MVSGRVDQPPLSISVFATAALLFLPGARLTALSARVALGACAALGLLLFVRLRLGRLLLIDALGTRFRELRVKRDPGCSVCGTAHA